MRLLLLFILLPSFVIGQVKIGQNINGEAAEDEAGYSVSLSNDGNTVAIGAITNDGANGSNSGQVRVYYNNAGTWTKIGADIDGEAQNNLFGYSISLSGDGNVVAVGAINNDNNGNNFAGHVRIYENNSGTWTQIGSDIDGITSYSLSGWSVSLSDDGSRVAIGAVGFNGNGGFEGYTRVYQNNSGTWVKIGQDINGEGNLDFSGWDVSLSGDGNILAVGATFNDGVSGDDSGHVRVYYNNAGTWTQIGADIDGESANDQSGHCISLSYDGSIIAITSTQNDGVGGPDSGHVRVYQNNLGTWTQIGDDIDGEAANEQSGQGVSLSDDGSVLAVGAYSSDTNGINAGDVIIYKNMGGTWTKIGNSILGESAGDWSGWSVSLSADGSKVAIGSRYSDANGNSSGQVRVFDLTPALSTNSFENNDFVVYPNPATSMVHIKVNNAYKLQNIVLYNNLGQFIINTKTNTLDLSALTNGMYFLEIKTEQGTSVRKLLKN